MPGILNWETLVESGDGQRKEFLWTEFLLPKNFSRNTCFAVFLYVGKH